MLYAGPALEQQLAKACFRFIECLSDHISCCIHAIPNPSVPSLRQHPSTRRTLNSGPPKGAVEVLSRSATEGMDRHPDGARQVIRFCITWRKVFLLVRYRFISPQPKRLLHSPRSSLCSPALSRSSCDMRTFRRSSGRETRRATGRCSRTSSLLPHRLHQTSIEPALLSPPPPHGCVSRHRHRHRHPVPHYGTYLILPWRSRAPARILHLHLTPTSLPTLKWVPMIHAAAQG